MLFLDLINKNANLKKLFINIEEMFWKKEILGITDNSLNVKKNYIFVAIKGKKNDGNKFIDQARSNGSKLIISSVKNGKDIIQVKNTNLRYIYSLLCTSFYYNKPSQIVAVTGTNGKTSVVEFCRQIWHLAGWKSASIGTLGTIISDDHGSRETETRNFTTLEPFLLHKELTELSKKNVSHLALEASSHGIDQDRLSGINFCGAVFTNLSHDHLDYHTTFSNYFETKKKLFSNFLIPGSVVSINLDDQFGLKLYNEIKNEPYFFVNFGKSELANLKIIEKKFFETVWYIKIQYKNYTIQTSLGMLGEFQIYNALASAAISIGLNMDPKFVLNSLPYLKNAPGRMQIVDGHPKNATIVIDYAHTPDALEKAINSLKPHVKGRLYTLFGCGGNRDYEKRELMGKISFTNSDFTIITDDNPRNESPKKIRKDILKGCPNGIEIAGRDVAIKKTINILKENDFLLISGKGHETTQTIGTESLPFDDLSVAKLSIKNLVDESK